MAVTRYLILFSRQTTCMTFGAKLFLTVWVGSFIR